MHTNLLGWDQVVRVDLVVLEVLVDHRTFDLLVLLGR